MIATFQTGTKYQRQGKRSGFPTSAMCVI